MVAKSVLSQNLKIFLFEFYFDEKMDFENQISLVPDETIDNLLEKMMVETNVNVRQLQK